MLEQINKELTELDFTRICVNSWVYRSDFCNAYLNIVGENVEIEIQTTNTNRLFINQTYKFSSYTKELAGKIPTMCMMLDAISQRAVVEIENTLNYIN